MRFRLTYHLSLIRRKALLITYHFKVKRGFTLIELLVVITIIAILVASATTSWRNAQMKGRDGKRKSDLKAVQQALENYYQVNGQYPPSVSGKISCDGVTGFIWNNSPAFTCNSITYMQQLPKDTVNQPSGPGYYYTRSGVNSYVLSAYLENTNDPDLTGLTCTPQASRNWCVTNP